MRRTALVTTAVALAALAAAVVLARGGWMPHASGAAGNPLGLRLDPASLPAYVGGEAVVLLSVDDVSKLTDKDGGGAAGYKAWETNICWDRRALALKGVAFTTDLEITAEAPVVTHPAPSFLDCKLIGASYGPFQEESVQTGTIARLTFTVLEHAETGGDTSVTATGGRLYDENKNELADLSDSTEAFLAGSGSTDEDGDGCSAAQELGPDEALGGRRNPGNAWDFFDINGDRVVNGMDEIFGVAFAFGATAGDPSYSAALDRSAPKAAPEEPDPARREAWDMGPPDGVVDLFVDIFGVAFQFGHSCA
jgi:hypothetical protein